MARLFYFYFCLFGYFFFFKQKTAYEMRISDWSSDVCSSDLVDDRAPRTVAIPGNAGGDLGLRRSDRGDDRRREASSCHSHEAGHPLPRRAPVDRKSVV